MRWAAAALVALLAAFDWTGRLGHLSREAHDPDPAVRAEAVRQLAELSPDDVEALVLAALEDEDPDVRAEAARVAARLRLRSAVGVLSGWLDAPDDEVRALALETVGALDGDSVTAALVRGLADPRGSVRAAAVRGLAVHRGDGAMRALAGALADDDGTVRLAAVGAIAERARLATERGEASEVSADVLSSHASDEAPEVRTAIAEALGALGDAGATPVLRRLLSDGTPAVRAAATTALGRLRATDATTALSVLASGEDEVALAAIAALGRIPGQAAFDGLVRAASRLEEGPGALGEAAHHALGERVRLDGDAARAEIVRGLHEAERAAQRWLTHELSLGIAPDLPEAAVPLVAAIGDGRIDADEGYLALGFAGGEAALTRLLVALTDDGGRALSPAVRGLAAYFDVTGADGRATEPLAAALPLCAPGDRAPLATLLGRTHSPRAVAPLVRLLEDAREPAVRVAGLEALTAIARSAGVSDDERPSAIAVAEAAVRAPEPGVRAAGRDALGEVGDAAALERAVAAIEHEAHVERALLLDAAGRIAERVDAGPERAALRAVLERRARGEDRELAAAAVDAAASAGELDLLIALAEDDAHALTALGRIDDDAARAVLRGTLEADGVRTPRTAERMALAAAALGEHGERADAERLATRLPELPWPASAAASFALARLARRGVLTAEDAPLVCGLAGRHDPVVRANVLVALTALGARCESPLDAWARRPHTPIVRAAAMRFVATTPDGAVALARCRDDLPPPLVEAACAAPTLPPLGARADVTAYEADGRHLARGAWLALVLGDGSVLLTRTDARGRILLENAPEGAMALEDPVNLGFED